MGHPHANRRCSTYGKLRKLSLKRRLKPQDNMLLLHIQCDQLPRHIKLSPIVLNPDFAINNIQMQNTAVNPPMTSGRS